MTSFELPWQWRIWAVELLRCPAVFVPIMKCWVCLQCYDITGTDMCPSRFITVAIDKQQTNAHETWLRIKRNSTNQSIKHLKWVKPADLYVSRIIQCQNLRCNIFCLWNNNRSLNKYWSTEICVLFSNKPCYGAPKGTWWWKKIWDGRKNNALASIPPRNFALPGKHFELFIGKCNDSWGNAKVLWVNAFFSTTTSF